MCQPLSLPNVLPSLQSGLIDACYGTPLTVLALQWFTKVKYRTSLAITNVMGACCSDALWQQLSADQQTLVREAVRKYNAKAVMNMRQYETKALTLLQTTAGIETIPVAEKKSPACSRSASKSVRNWWASSILRSRSIGCWRCGMRIARSSRRTEGCPMRLLHWLDHWLASLERALVVLLLSGLLGLGLLQVIERNVLASGLFWADELLQHLVLWLGFGLLATREQRHLSIDVLSHFLPTPALARVADQHRSARAVYAPGPGCLGVGAFRVHGWHHVDLWGSRLAGAKHHTAGVGAITLRFALRLVQTLPDWSSQRPA